MKQHHQWSIDEIESMIPWERDIYVNLLKQHVDEEKKKHEESMKR